MYAGLMYSPALKSTWVWDITIAWAQAYSDMHPMKCSVIAFWMVNAECIVKQAYCIGWSNECWKPSSAYFYKGMALECNMGHYEAEPHQLQLENDYAYYRWDGVGGKMVQCVSCLWRLASAIRTCRNNHRSRILSWKDFGWESRSLVL